MLSKLHISNYALIEQMDIEFGAGLTMITGETGAGKSIVMGALMLILGERADVKSMRNNSQKTVVEATFNLEHYDLKPLFDTADIDFDEHECILRREILTTGRTRAFVNDTPVSLAFLRELATRLVDIHSQHSNMLLANPQFQLAILDSLAENETLRHEYDTIYQEYRDTQRHLQALTNEFDKAKNEEDYMRFQLDQLQAMNLRPDEDAELEAEQAKLSHVTDIKQNLWDVEHLLNDDQCSVIDNLKVASSRLLMVEQLMPEAAGLSQRVDSALIELKDIAETVSTAQEQLLVDPARLEAIDNRLNEIYNLQRKHQAQSVNELIRIQHNYESRLAELDNGDARLRQMQDDLCRREQEARNLAHQISISRQAAAQAFAEHLIKKARLLALGNLRFDVTFHETELMATGSDAVEFMMAFNKSQPLMPVRETASGGEISRVMLCIKAIVAQRVSLPTIIFDEVDTGVGGDTASRMGDMMGDMARDIQVIAITHLPQVASHGNHHFKVYKTDEGDRTVTRMLPLDEENRVMEIARMLSGKDVNQAAIENAKALVNQNLR